MTSLESLVDPTSGWNLYEAKAINDSGQIAAYGCRGPVQTPECHALLLSPNSNNVPEPSTLALLSLGLVGISFRRSGIRAR